MNAIQQPNSFNRQRQHTRSKRMNLIGACELCLARDQLPDNSHGNGRPVFGPIATAHNYIRARSEILIAHIRIAYNSYSLPLAQSASRV